MQGTDKQEEVASSSIKSIGPAQIESTLALPMLDCIRFQPASLLLISAVLTAGCIQTATLPAHQVDRGETVASASVDVPASAWIPRANVQVTQGWGGGDVSANVSGSFSLFGGGLSGRYYVSDNLNAELQVQTGRVFEDWTTTAFGGIQQAATNDRPWYLGIHGGLLNGEKINVNLPESYYSRKTLPMIGSTIGVGKIELGETWTLQVEMEVNATIPYTDEASVPPSRISIGLFRTWE